MRPHRAHTAGVAVLALVAVTIVLVIDDRSAQRRGPLIIEPELTTGWTVRPDLPATVTATFHIPESAPNLASPHIRILGARIGRRPALVRASATMIRATLEARGFALGRRYGVELTYRDELSDETRQVRFPEVLRTEAVTICDPASPC